ncbi:uncharacterized protein OCT59_006812 [Rhizophagus irregularis]|uniref:AAA+ ATPase domain-containing protein n=2 Tax=Rhizophagus irregularis TaxID=588596 RepID=A0A015NDH8_RHIIW|nr:hypothetical protein GLOIN_2v725998 [Rhizophagus irregularis DAOM 181602=DAOM 197198]EXX77298.1 hypothetical protein RirG_025040 [Rhizophagus irregularis DAOM 197198w]POG61099.1 hypothetical protein GLOIN_2v725998 [Rhizophagus irregularis DAOM 181602=DAOM 197198]UZO15385.1 hypothetical protein OCT59_006812 [Rhizophagus irregularis]GBC32399.1 P-loop containing nucleoside triphosphate hydrolase protein [Rhizophagus irregularis DAOM 181602=DAOM 197198]|eukprot:XP_025167965.1 hypothetical protein GLOIN_2v725998 [Rhizophagus irregularis DAOM 181602=DAOM 197198]
MFVTKPLRRLPTALKNNRVVRFTTFSDPGKTFFSRKRELIEFKKVFNYEVPRINVILGPPNTGKTTLVREVVSRDNFKPLFIDCRGGHFNTPTCLYNSLICQFDSFFNYELSERNGYSEKTAKDIIELLNTIGDFFLSWSSWKGQNEQLPILIIDEVNKFSQLGSSKEGEIILVSFLDWLVKITKQDKKFPIVLITSDSLFLDWITQMLDISHVTPYVVGDLSRDEAEEFFEKHVLPRHDSKVRKELEGKFNHISEFTGTRMFIINQFVDEYEIHKGDFEKFSVYQQEYDRLICGLYPEDLNLANLARNTHAPLWNKSDFIETIKAIVESHKKIILEHDLVKLIGKSKVDSLLKYKFLYKRPTNNFVNDIINPPNKPILTPMNQPSMYAMKNLLKRKYSEIF